MFFIQRICCRYNLFKTLYDIKSTKSFILEIMRKTTSIYNIFKLIKPLCLFCVTSLFNCGFEFHVGYELVVKFGGNLKNTTVASQKGGSQ